MPENLSASSSSDGSDSESHKSSTDHEHSSIEHNDDENFGLFFFYLREINEIKNYDMKTVITQRMIPEWKERGFCLEIGEPELSITYHWILQFFL